MSHFKSEEIGIVANDKKVGSNTIRVFPQQQLGEYEGVITYEDKENTKSVSSSGSGVLVGSVSKQPTITADWVNLGGSNRVTSPDVMKGETVILYRVGGADKWFWSMMRGETDLRRKETIVNVYGNTDEHGEQLTNENSYYTVMDTKGKKIGLHTADNDDEVAKFDIDIDTKEGVVTIKDSNGNSLIHNANGTLTAVYKKKVTIKAPDIVLDGEVRITKNLKVDKRIDDVKGTVTDHTHKVVKHKLALPR